MSVLYHVGALLNVGAVWYTFDQIFSIGDGVERPTWKSIPDTKFETPIKESYSLSDLVSDIVDMVKDLIPPPTFWDKVEYLYDSTVGAVVESIVLNVALFFL
ncbi:hypothetical protein F2Z80_25240 [Vibrio fortis]|uniref:Uncharacterized protein n=1 Tax=Vibrio fortis TaxID=212667 RepID=A0A5N3RZF8_9VIBR|nr:hypothetical protein [Vibrio fortis]KAB0299145.1 hypothetical protein F2Z80_25240 [Vibrio fortis]|tara:strand:+ start:1236 stop:1541 length:306 start_codon:yes stop_codon:yes gene_type:complete